MAAGSKPTAVHFTLIFFVMLSLFLGVFAYMYFDEYKTAVAKLGEAQRTSDSNARALDVALQEKSELIRHIGYDFTDIGGTDVPNSVLGALHTDFRNVAGLMDAPPQEQTVREIVAALASQAQARAEVSRQAQDSEASTTTNFQQQTRMQQEAVTKAEEAQRKAETDLREVERTTQEKIDNLTAQRDQIQQEYRTVLGELETTRDQFAQAQEDWAKQRKQLTATIEYQRETIAQLENISFERPDGEVQLVDNTTRSVWINRGSKDYLRPQVTFSVYTKDHQGIARSTADVKAKIEVVEVDVTSARCKILEEDLTRPIAPGDPIYSPLWEQGRTENIAFVGIIDLDGDGVSDRELLQEMVDVAFAKIKLQVLDDGTRSPPEATLDVDTKFLVIGEIPDKNDYPGLDEKQRHIDYMMDELLKLKDEARANGVEIINLNEFLVWVGYKNQQNIFRPGENMPFRLGAGAQSGGVGESYQDRTSEGTTSSLFQNPRDGGRDSSSRYGR
ncbi:MAG: hypothetical protein R3B90_10370 [Planctomycetaceae bacterium]